MKYPTAFGQLFSIVTLAALLVGATVISILYTGVDHGESRTPLLLAVLAMLVLAPLAGLAAAALYMRDAKNLQLELLQRAESFQILAETAREGIVLADSNGRIEFVNRAVENLFGYDRGELLGDSVERLMPQEYAVAHQGYMNNYLETGVPRIIGTGRQLTAIDKHGKRFPIYLSIGDIKTSQRRIFAGVILDMTEEQELQREILEIPINEQRRIGQELHDGLGQQLTGLGLLATSLLNKASKPEYELAAQLAGGLQEAISQVRALSRGLVPVDVEAGDFIHALESLVENLRLQTGLAISLEIRDRVKVIDNSYAIHLYRIAQEAVNNALKHAEAKRIRVTVGREGNRGYLSIRDDGKGLETKPGRRQGLGLRIMKYRCGLIDAELVVESAVAEGCEIKCYFALDR